MDCVLPVERRAFSQKAEAWGETEGYSAGTTKSFRYESDALLVIGDAFREVWPGRGSPSGEVGEVFN